MFSAFAQVKKKSHENPKTQAGFVPSPSQLEASISTFYGKETNRQLPVQSSLPARLLHITEHARLLPHSPYLNLHLLKYETALAH